MVEYSKANVKWSDTQLQKLKTTVKNNARTTLRMSLKIFDRNDLLHELLLTTRQITKLRNACNNNMSTDMKLSKAQISKIFQSKGFLGSLWTKEFVGNKNIIAKIFRVQANNSVMCGYFCIGFIDFMLAVKKVTDFASLFSPYGFEKNDNMILSYFKDV